MLLLWPGWVRRKREDDFGQIGPALFAGTNNSDSSMNKISSTSYLRKGERNKYDFNNLIQIIGKICKIVLITRATLCSSLVPQ